MTVNKDEIRRLDAAKLLEWLNVEIDMSIGNDPTLKTDRWAFIEVRKAIERGIFDAPPDAKDAEIERLKMVRNELAKQMTKWMHEADARLRLAEAAIRESLELRQQNAELREVLEWYADEHRYDYTSGEIVVSSTILTDGGHRARTILARIGAEDTQEGNVIDG